MFVLEGASVTLNRLNKGIKKRGDNCMPHLIFLILSVLAIHSLQAPAQDDKLVRRHDSVTVSAGIPKEQLALEGQLNGVISQGDQALKNGDASDAIKKYESALDLVHNQPLLA